MVVKLCVFVRRHTVAQYSCVYICRYLNWLTEWLTTPTGQSCDVLDLSFLFVCSECFLSSSCQRRVLSPSSSKSRCHIVLLFCCRGYCCYGFVSTVKALIVLVYTVTAVPSSYQSSILCWPWLALTCLALTWLALTWLDLPWLDLPCFDLTGLALTWLELTEMPCLDLTWPNLPCFYLPSLALTWLVLWHWPHCMPVTWLYYIDLIIHWPYC